MYYHFSDEELEASVPQVGQRQRGGGICAECGKRPRKQPNDRGGEVDTRQLRQQDVSELRGCPQCEARGRHANAGKHAQELGSACRPQGLPEGPDTHRCSQVGA